MKYEKIIITLRPNILNMKVFYPINRYIAILILLVSGLHQNIYARSDTPKHEVRAVWLTTIGGLDWPHSYSRSEQSAAIQKQELCNILDKLKAANINTVLLQTRVRGTVIYPSAYEPWDGCMSGVPGTAPGYDPLAFAIDECHKRGMELHAWVVTIPVGKWTKEGCRRLRTKYPSMIKKIGDEGYMNPERKETGKYLAGICREIADNYDIDGIHLDYIRYPETWNGRLDRTQGRRNITQIVREISTAVKCVKPWVKMSCSPIGKYDDLTRYWSHGWNARTKVCQDAQAWLRDGLMDELFPMMYFRGDQFYPFALDWKENSYGRIISIGLGIYFMSPKEKDWGLDVITRQMNVLRSQGMGHAYFRSKFFTDNLKGLYDIARTEIDNHPALIPPMTWQSDAMPLPPSRISVRAIADGDLLTWSGARDMSDGPYLLYNVYASTEYPVNTSDARNLIATRYRNETVIIPRKEGMPQLHYAVTATNRYGNESIPAETPANDGISYESDFALLLNNGFSLQIPDKGQTLDADYLTIETLQGSIIATRHYRGSSIDISDISEGMYILRSLGRKGKPHRMGFFIIKRH